MHLIAKSLFTVSLICCAITSIASTDAHHFPAIFVGVSHADETDFSYGLEYEYKFNHQWGAGAVWEKTADAHHGDGVTVKVASLFYHPGKNLRLGVGFGEEKIGGAHPHSEDLNRLSVSYDIHLKHFGMAPSLAVDFIDNEEVYVLGVAFIKAF